MVKLSCIFKANLDSKLLKFFYCKTLLQKRAHRKRKIRQKRKFWEGATERRNEFINVIGVIINILGIARCKKFAVKWQTICGLLCWNIKLYDGERNKAEMEIV